MTTIYVYNAIGQLIAEYTDSNQSSSGGTSYLTADSLGSTRVLTDSTGSVKDRHDYLPFGEEIASYVSGRSNVGAQDYKVGDLRQKFTGKERDNETELDYFGARYYSSTQGRFTSVDQGEASPTDPQSWNRYRYARNNPLYYVDPDGNKDEPAKSEKINQVLAQDPTLLEVIKASNNFSQRAFEDALLRGGLRGNMGYGSGNILRGAAGEATVIDYLRESGAWVVSQPAGRILSAIGVDADIPNNMAPDIGAAFVGAAIPNAVVTLNSSVQNSKGDIGSTELPEGTKFALYEVKSGFTGGTITKGAAQVAATAAFLKASGAPGVAVLVVDKDAFNRLSASRRALIYNTVSKAGGYIQIYNRLAQEALDRSKRVRDKASR